MAAGCGCECSEILVVGGDDLVPVDREQHDTGVDDLSEAGCSEKLPRCSPERLVQGADVGAFQRLG